MWCAMVKFPSIAASHPHWSDVTQIGRCEPHQLVSENGKKESIQGRVDIML